MQNVITHATQTYKDLINGCLPDGDAKEQALALVDQVGEMCLAAIESNDGSK